MWIAGKPKDADSLLVELSTDSADEVAAAALTDLAKTSPEKALAGATQALKSKSVTRRQSAWTVLATIPGEAAAQLIAKGVQDIPSPQSDKESQLEILEAAAKRGEPAVKAALSAYESGLNPADLLAKWMPALYGGNAERGGGLFFSHGSASASAATVRVKAVTMQAAMQARIWQAWAASMTGFISLKPS